MKVLVSKAQTTPYPLVLSSNAVSRAQRQIPGQYRQGVRERRPQGLDFLPHIPSSLAVANLSVYASCLATVKPAAAFIYNIR